MLVEMDKKPHITPICFSNPTKLMAPTKKKFHIEFCTVAHCTGLGYASKDTTVFWPGEKNRNYE